MIKITNETKFWQITKIWEGGSIFLNNLDKAEKLCGKIRCNPAGKNAKFYTQLYVSGCTATGCGKHVTAAAFPKLLKGWWTELQLQHTSINNITLIMKTHLT